MLPETSTANVSGISCSVGDVSFSLAGMAIGADGLAGTGNGVLRIFEDELEGRFRVEPDRPLIASSTGSSVELRGGVSSPSDPDGVKWESGDGSRRFLDRSPRIPARKWPDD